jgi:MFS family permease
VLQLSRYQWTVFAAAWLGWGFDVFDGLLFNYVAPNAIPTLLGLPIGSPEAKSAALYWTGLLTSIFLLGWAAGGVIFGPISDRYGRRNTLMVTMLLYALGTAACAFVTDIWQLLACRVIASLGIGGEWAAGAAMVAEVVPDRKRGRGASCCSLACCRPPSPSSCGSSSRSRRSGSTRPPPGPRANPASSSSSARCCGAGR